MKKLKCSNPDCNEVYEVADEVDKVTCAECYTEKEEEEPVSKDKKEIQEDTKGKEIEIKRESCPHFNRCSAPLCPLCTKEELENYLWYPDEEICRKKHTPRWIKKQKRIARICRDKNRYFTLAMLKRLYKISRGTIGIDPDRDEERQLKTWFKLHPKREKRVLTEEQKEILREQLKKARTKIGSGLPQK